MKYLSKIVFLLLPLLLLIGCAAEEKAKVISGSKDLDSCSVIVLTGSTQEIYATKHYTSSEIKRMETISDQIVALQNKMADAVLLARPIWDKIHSSFPELVVVEDGIDRTPIGIAFSKKEGVLRMQFNDFLHAYMQTPEFIEMQEDWTRADSKRALPEVDEAACTNGVLQIAVTPEIQPYGFLKDGKPAGIEYEIVVRFAISVGMKPEFMCMNFGAIIPCIASGKAQVGCSEMCITEERQKSVDFSDPWMTESSVLVTNIEHAPDSLRKAVQQQQESALQMLKSSFKSNILAENRYKLLWDGLMVTIYIALMAALFGTLLGMLLCYFSMCGNKHVSRSTNVFIELMRCMPQVVFLMIMFYLVFGGSDASGELVAIVAFSICFAAYTSVIFRTTIQGIDKGQTEAALSMGYTQVKSFLNFILPQVVQRALPIYKGEFIGLVKATSIVGYIAVFDLTKAGDMIRSRTYEAFFPLIVVTILYFLVIWILSLLLKYAEIKTQPKRRKFFK